MNKIPVSVIIPCYNSADSLQRAVDSVLMQTKIPKEIILVDDCSSDEGRTLEKIYAIKNLYCNKVFIVVLALPINQGAGSARNAGWDIASQEYIAFLDSDDAWHKKKLELQYEWMKNHPNIVITGHKYKKISDINKFNNEAKILLNHKFIHKYRLLIKNNFATPTIMLRKEIHYRFKKGKRYSEDYLLWLQISIGKEIIWLDSELTGLFKSNYGEAGLSAQLWNMERGELDTYFILYKQNLIGISTFLAAISFSVFKYLFRLIKVKLYEW